MESFKIKQIEDLPNEIWRDVIEYDGYYEISNLGRVKVLPRLRITPSGGEWLSKEKIMAIDLYKKNTPQIVYNVNGIKNKRTLYKQVALHFMQNYNDEPIFFKDGNPLNVSLNNLIIVDAKNYFKIFNKNKNAINNDTALLIFNNGERRCVMCNEIKKLNVFTNNSLKINNMYKNHTCNVCHNKYMKKRGLI